MATRPALLLPLVTLHWCLISSAQSTLPTQSRSVDFINSSCQATRYPALCVSTLSRYADEVHEDAHSLARVALTVSLSSARAAESHAESLVGDRGVRREEYLAIKDCIQTLGDGVDRLAESIDELGGMRRRTAGPDFEWHVSNVQTWVSAALTDDYTCLDGFRSRAMDRDVKAGMHKSVIYAARVTSNALALFNRFATMRRRAHRGGRKP